MRVDALKRAAEEVNWGQLLVWFVSTPVLAAIAATRRMRRGR